MQIREWIRPNEPAGSEAAIAGGYWDNGGDDDETWCEDCEAHAGILREGAEPYGEKCPMCGAIMAPECGGEAAKCLSCAFRAVRP